MAEAGADAGGDDPSTQGGEDHEDDSGKDDPCDGGLAGKRGSYEGRGSPSESVPDMYRALDGSALMAIGTSILAGCIARDEREVYQACCSKSTYRYF